MESDGYQDPVCVKDANDDEDDDENTDEDDGYETTLTYDILSNSPVELFLFVECLEP